MKTALVLAGHGSHISPETAGLVWAQVDALRRAGAADEVTAAFWKEVPSFATVIDSLVAEDVTIIPLFTASGYFTRTVIPDEMGLTGTITERDGRTLRYARSLGEHPYVGEVVARRVGDALRQSGFPLDQVGVAVIGHGTARSPESRDSTRAQASALVESGLVREAVAVFLEDTPAISDLYTLLASPYIIAVPNFLALGSHTTIDVPQALGLPRGATRGIVGGRRVWYTPPVGLDDSLTDAVLDLAREVGMPPRESDESTHPALTGMWDGFPAAGRDDLIEAVLSAGSLQFGQMLLTPEEVGAEGSCAAMLEDLADLREYVRTRTEFRPLAYSADLPGAWCMSIKVPEQIHAVVETVYPGTAADWAAYRRGTFQTRSLEELIARQSGQYRRLSELEGDDCERLITKVCSQCVRHPTWRSGTSPEGAIPCPEPCSVWMSRAMELLDEA